MHLYLPKTLVWAYIVSKLETFLQSDTLADDPTLARTPSISSSTSLLPAAQITPEKDSHTSPILDQRLRDGLNLERPGSALHSGDFTHDDSSEDRRLDSPRPQRETSRLERADQWLDASPPRNYAPFNFDHRRGFREADTFKSPSSLSSSASSSFVYKPPTSPLVQSESNEDADFSTSLDGLERLLQRRHTFNSANSSPFTSPSVRSPLPPRVPSHRREGSLPYQAHQPRRSLTGTPNLSHLGSSPQTPAFLRSRRQSIGSDSSPLHHASMVGSYEESILRGRMSTNPSKPLDFVAQIGVLGMGKCKSSLRCPPHVTLPFPAVYYSYSTIAHGRQRAAEDGPSPYVGQIDLENGLTNASDGSRSRRKAQSRYIERSAEDGDVDAVMQGQDGDEGHGQRISRPSRRQSSPKAPPGGSYRIPEKGQIQIIIKNQNKTAVKLFLVPYDLAGMEPGTKTFIRQRSYSAGPIIEGIPASSPLDAKDRPILRYLVHLHICCPAKGRFYLYKSVRIVFANRVPDGKEKLRNETTWPEPRFSPYKPIRVMHPPLSQSIGAGAMLTADKAYRRRSSGFSFAPSSHHFDAIDEMRPPAPMSLSRATSTGSASGNTLPIDPIPFRLPSRGGTESDNSDATATTGITAALRSPTSSASRPSTKDSNGAQGLGLWAHGPARYEKLHKGDLGYGGNAFASFAPGSVGGAEGLLSQRLRSLGVERPTSSQDLEEEQ